MDNIFTIYFKTIKKDIFLLMAIFVIYILTAGIWLGFPLYPFEETFPIATSILFPLVSALLFSLGFVFTNKKVAKLIHQTKSQRSVFQWTLYFQLCVVGILFLLILVGFMILLYLS
ncbi:hypothetical protein [Virgibacillus halodenitrificans]|uniref:hypothetical protein n=1 Tax=Virgibacillus halodenitrificans TaxID=1482 RepID=UPI00045CC1E9|nr:hypothetical protein [Virgibacillus halodenitrificans]CDQ37289.1 hypothetical protein BN993_06833 [Virgibacillus halodenitrificans]